MGSEIHYEATVEHPELGQITWGLWEYPVGIENHHETDAGAHEVVKDFDYGLSVVSQNPMSGSITLSQTTHSPSL